MSEAKGEWMLIPLNQQYGGDNPVLESWVKEGEDPTAQNIGPYRCRYCHEKWNYRVWTVAMGEDRRWVGGGGYLPPHCPHCQGNALVHFAIEAEAAASDPSSIRDHRP